MNKIIQFKRYCSLPRSDTRGTVPVVTQIVPQSTFFCLSIHFLSFPLLFRHKLRIFAHKYRRLFLGGGVAPLLAMQNEYDMLMAERNESFMEKLKYIRRIAAVF